MANFDKNEQVEKELQEELDKWHKLGMKVQGVPTAFMKLRQIPVSGLPVELLELEAKLEAACSLLMEHVPEITDENLTLHYRQYLLKRLKATREANEEQIKQARADQRLSVARAQILGPNGTPMKPIQKPNND